ncbi:MAG: hypothetical protein ACE5KI_05655 [Dehalococcoidia bacterium]
MWPGKKARTSALDSSAPLKVANPMRSDQECLRLSLRPGLLTNVSLNEKHSEDSLRFFELGKVYLPRDGELPVEKDVLAGVITQGEGDSEEGFLEAKGVVETLLARLGVDARFEPGSDPSLHPGRVVALKSENDSLGVMGEVHPQVIEGFDIESSSVHLFEIDLETLLRHVPSTRSYKPISRFPGVVRDIAILVPVETPARIVEDLIRSFPLVTGVKLFDLYSGDQVPADKKSLAYRVVYQSPSRTLTEEEVSVVQAQLIQKLNQELGAELRGTTETRESSSS